MASFPGQKGTGPPLPNQVGGVVATLQGSGGVLLPGAPGFPLKLLEGVTGQSQGIYNNTANDFQGSAPNRCLYGIQIGTTGSFPIASINHYRTINQAQAPGSYPFYQSVTVATALAAYSAYVTASSNAPATLNEGFPPGQTAFPFSRICTHAINDAAATNCIAYPAGAGNDQYLGIGYNSEFTCVDNQGNEGPRSAATYLPYLADGFPMLATVPFNGTVSYADTSAPISPLGYTRSVLWTVTQSGDNIINFPAGYGTRQYGAQILPYNFFIVSICPHQTWNNTLQAEMETIQDVFIDQPAGNIYQPQFATLGNAGTLNAGQWYTWKLPLYNSGGIYFDATRGNQHSWYKITIQKPDQNGTASVEAYFSVT